MIKKFFWIGLSVLLLFGIENIFYDFFRFWFRPNFILLLVIVLNLTWGIRYGLVISFLAGFLKDSYSAGPLGAHVLAFVLCSYFIFAVRKFFLQMDTFLFRCVITAMTVFFNVLVLYLVYSLYESMNLQHAFLFVLLPQTLSTVLVASFLFDFYQKCALKLSD